MSFQLGRVVGTFNVGRATAAGGTAFTALIPPYPGPPGAAKNIFDHDKRNFGGIVAVVTKVCYTTGATAHQIGIMRPFNYAQVNGAALINQAVINLTDNPGTYSTKYKYASPITTGTAQVADNGIAANDYCAYQLVDGTWVVDTVSSVATLAITMTTVVPNITGGGVADKALFYFFGVIGDSNPANGLVNPQNTIAASQTRDASWADNNGIVAAFNPGDPMLFYSPNGTNAGVLEYLSGVYVKIA